MDIQSITALVSEFKEHANVTKNDLMMVLNLLTEGKVPSEELKETILTSLGELQGKYNHIYQLVKDTATNVECPDSGAGVDELSEVIRKEAAIRLQDEVNAAKETIDKFMHITSTVERYLKALEPFQKEAGNMLLLLAEKEMTKEINSAVQAQNVFLRLVEEEIEDEEQDTLLDFISDQYSSTIQKGLAKGKYVIDFNKSTGNTEKPLAKPEKNQTTLPVKTDDDKNKPKKREVTVKAHKQNNVQGIINETISPDKTQKEGAEIVKPSGKKADKDKPEGVSVQKDKSVDNAAVEPNEEREIVYIEAESKIKTSKVTASAFKQDIEKKCPPESMTIVPVLSQLGVVTEDLFVKHFRLFSNADIDKVIPRITVTLNKLIQMGYVVKFSLAPRHKTIYCLTSRAAECFARKSVIDMQWRQKLQPPFFIGIQEVREDMISDILEENELLYNYFEYTWDPDEKHVAWKRSAEFIPPVDEIEIGKKDNKAWYKIANAGLMKNHPENENILVVDRKYSEFSPSNHVLYLDELIGKNEDPENVKEENAPGNDESTTLEGSKDQSASDASLGLGNTVDPLDSEETKPQNSDNGSEGTVSMPDVSIEAQDTKSNKQTTKPEVKSVDQPAEIKVEAENSESSELEKLIEGNNIPTDEEFHQMILSFLDGSMGSRISDKSPVIEAVLMAKAAAGITGNHKCNRFYKQLLLATRLPLEKLHYSSEHLAEVFADDEDQLEAAKLAAYMNALVYPERAYDYGLTGTTKSYLRDFEEVFPSFPGVKALFSELTMIEKTIPSGFSPSVLARLGDAATSEKYVSGLQKQAKDYLNVPIAKARIKFLPILYSRCFGSNSDLYSAMSVITHNSIDDLDIVKACLMDYCEDNSVTNINEQTSYVIDQSKIENMLDDNWYIANGNNSRFPLEFGSRTLTLRYFEERIQLMKEWVEYAEGLSTNRSELSKIKGLRDKIEKQARETLNWLEDSSVQGKELLLWSVKNFITGLNNKNGKVCKEFTDLLYTGVISLDDSGIPVMEDGWNQVKYYEPWRILLRHIVLLLKHYDTYEKAKDMIFDSSSDLLDNLQQLRYIYEQIGTKEELDYVNKEDILAAARNVANDNKKKFQETMELYYTYGRISEVDKESLLGIANQYQAAFYERKDFGVWRQFLKALLKRADEIYDSRRIELQKQLDIRFARIREKEEETPPILITAQKLLDKDNNFAVAEEYINQYDSGIKEEMLEEVQSSLCDSDTFSEFLNDRNFESIYNVCKKYKGKMLRNFGKDYCLKHFPEGWTSKYRDDCFDLIDNWPIKRGVTTEYNIKALFKCLGFEVEFIQKSKKKAEEIYELRVTPSEKSLPDYLHPIAKFGTQMKSPLNVVVLYGNPGGKQLVDKISTLNLGEFTIVLIDYFIDKPQRRQIAEEFHGTSGQNSFIFIDQVLALFLALHQKTERLPALLKCTLPYTTYQPFVRDGGSTADEMFCGRTVELATLIDPNGACVVYGGRQLGKTALLERTENRCSKPENKKFAVYSNLYGCYSEQEMVQTVCSDIANKPNLPRLSARNIKDLCNDIEKLFINRKVNTMYLLLDEADNFLNSISNQDYKPLQPLIDLKRKTKNNFKFVLAGLHNVCRAQNATANNGIFGQLGTPLCIKPLSQADALQLLSRPLKYLGFQVDRYPHLQTILTQTNYYPGILQFFGYKLIENLIGHYSKYYRAVDGHPPFTLEDELLGELISSEDLNKSIADKFRLSLKLDERYFMIARCIALLHYDQDEKRLNWLGYKIQEVIEIANEFPIYCLEKLTRSEYMVLLDEMVDMGILSRPEPEYYRLRRSSFIQIIGRDYAEVFEDIDNNNKEPVK